MLCKKCGNQVDENSNFCLFCGYNIHSNGEKSYNNASNIKKQQSTNENFLRKFNKQSLFLKITGGLTTLLFLYFIMTNVFNDKSSIDLKNYFPQKQKCIKMYSTYNNGKLFSNTMDTIEKENSKDDENIYISSDSDGIKRRYSVGKDIVKSLDLNDLSKEATTILTMQKSEWLLGKGKSFEIKAKITDTTKEISTKAGVFEECIEVTSTEIKNDKVIFTMKEYYAPNSGLVYSEDSCGMIVELTGIKYTSSTSIDSVQTTNPNTSNSDININAQGKIIDHYNNISDDKTKTKDNSQEVEGNYASSNDSKEMTILYINNTYNFSITLPKSWEGKYSVIESKADNIVRFNLIVDGKPSCNIFSMKILNKEYNANDFESKDIDKFICTHNGKTFIYMLPSEPSTEVLNDKSILELQMKMVNEDVQQIVKTIKFKF